MADTVGSQLDLLDEVPDSDDLFFVVDVSDSIMAAAGTDKKVVFGEVLTRLNLAILM